MSWNALAWAAQQKAGGSTDKLLLILLANYADEDGVSFPSHRTLAREAECSVATVERALDRLRVNGLVVISPRFDGRRQTSNEYVLNMGGILNLRGGEGGQNDDPITCKNKPNNSRYPEEFDLWWKTYPRRDGSKKKSFKLWQNAVDKLVDKTQLYEITVRYAHSVSNKDRKYIPHPETWLNQSRWETVDMSKPKVSLNSLAG